MAAALPIVTLFATVGSTLVRGFSRVKAGKEEARARKARAVELETSAAQARKSAAQEAEDVRKQHLRIIATQRARYGKAGVSILEDTPLFVQMESMRESEEELGRIIESGEIGAKGYERAAAEERRAARTARKTGYLEAFGEAAKGAGDVLGIGRQYRWW